MFLEQNSLYLAGKPRKATALLHFRLRYKNFSVLTKLRSTLKCEIIVQEKAKATDNADAYRWLLTHYCAVSSHFKEILPYGVSALQQPAKLFLSVVSLGTVLTHIVLIKKILLNGLCFRVMKYVELKVTDATV